jgi:hypothetical protein
MNCGRSAVKKTIAFGFAAWTAKARANTRPDPGSRVAGFAASTVPVARSARTPSQMRYAAPAHLMQKKRSYEARRIAPRPVAESRK